MTLENPPKRILILCFSSPRLSRYLEYLEVKSAPNNKIIADTYTQVNKAIIAPTEPYIKLYTKGKDFKYQENTMFAPVNDRDARIAPGKTIVKFTSVFGRNL